MNVLTSSPKVTDVNGNGFSELNLTQYEEKVK